VSGTAFFSAYDLGHTTNTQNVVPPSVRRRMKRGYADGPYGQVHYQDTGNAGTPLLLLPMGPCSSRMFDRCLPLFASAGIRAISIDPPGFGMSDPSTSPPTIEDWAGSCVAVLDHLGLERCSVLGKQTGALLAAELALKHSERVERVVFANPIVLTPEEREQVEGEAGGDGVR